MSKCIGWLATSMITSSNESHFPCDLHLFMVRDVPISSQYALCSSLRSCGIPLRAKCSSSPAGGAAQRVMSLLEMYHDVNYQVNMWYQQSFDFIVQMFFGLQEVDFVKRSISLREKQAFSIIFQAQEYQLGIHPKLTGWWFGTFFIFPYIGNNHPN